MVNRYLLNLTAGTLFFLTVVSGSSIEANKPKSVMLIVPARLRMIELAFDIRYLRDSLIMSYRGNVDTKEPLLHAWSGNNWSYIPFQDFADNVFLTTPAQQVILIGDARSVPKALIKAMSWCPDATRIETYNISKIINRLDDVLHFDKSEWQWLTKRYNLTLIDLNKDKRAYNPYNVPRSKLPLETRDFKQEEGELPPAILIEIPETIETPQTNAPAPTAEPAKPAGQPVETTSPK